MLHYKQCETADQKCGGFERMLLGTWSALVNIRRKAVLSSVGFRKSMTSRSPRSLICDSSARLCLNHTVQKDSREVLGTSFRFGPTSEILENIQYGGSSVVKTDS